METLRILFGVQNYYFYCLYAGIKEREAINIPLEKYRFQLHNAIHQVQPRLKSSVQDLIKITIETRLMILSTNLNHFASQSKLQSNIWKNLIASKESDLCMNKQLQRSESYSQRITNTGSLEYQLFYHTYQ